MYVYVNGKIEQYEIADLMANSIRSGLGLIETMFCQKGKIPYWPQHFKRLQSSCQRLGFPVLDLSEKEILQEIEALILQNNHSELCTVRMQFFLSQQQLFRLIETNASKYFGFESGKKRVGLAQEVSLSRDEFSDLKTTARLPYDLATEQAQKNGWYDSLILNSEGRISESTISNVFWIKDHVMFTPPLSEACINGIMRQHVLEAEMPFHIREKIFTLQSLRNADEVFLTNAVRGIQSIDFFEEKVYETIISTGLISSFKISNKD